MAAAVGNEFIGGSFPLLTIFSEAIAGGAVLALVTHAMIPTIEEAGSLIVLPTTAGFLTALYLALTEYPVRQ